MSSRASQSQSKGKSASKSPTGSSSSKSTTTKRLLQELSQIQASRVSTPSTVLNPPTTSASAAAIERLGPVSEDDLFRWEAVLLGKGLGGGYEAGRWLLDIRVPETYPFAPPGVRFVTGVVGANVAFETGEICLDLLKDAWTPAYTLQSTVEAIWQMLANPGVDSPLNVDVAALLRQGDSVGAEGLVRFYVGEREGFYGGR